MYVIGHNGCAEFHQICQHPGLRKGKNKEARSFPLIPERRKRKSWFYMSALKRATMAPGSGKLSSNDGSLTERSVYFLFRVLERGMWKNSGKGFERLRSSLFANYRISGDFAFFEVHYYRLRRIPSQPNTDSEKEASLDSQVQKIAAGHHPGIVPANLSGKPQSSTRRREHRNLASCLLQTSC